MEVTIREKNPGPQITIKKNDEEVMSSANPPAEPEAPVEEPVAAPAEEAETPAE